jgi:enoyl-CoA hydratase
MSDSVILVETAGPGYALVTLNRPASMNALSLQLCRELVATIDRLEADARVRVLILTGAGRAFCAGMDLKELGASGGGPIPDAATDVVQALSRFSGPVIGAINGVAVAGGFELVLACDVLIASTQARFADTHARVGLMPSWGLSQQLSRAIGVRRAKELSLTGNFLSAQQAEAWGLVNRVVEPDQLLAQARALAADMLSVIPEMLRDYKKLIDDGYAIGFGDALRLERERARLAGAAASPADIERRRLEVLARGRTQTGGT